MGVCRAPSEHVLVCATELNVGVATGAGGTGIWSITSADRPLSGLCVVNPSRVAMIKNLLVDDASQSARLTVVVLVLVTVLVPYSYWHTHLTSHKFCNWFHGCLPRSSEHVLVCATKLNVGDRHWRWRHRNLVNHRRQASIRTHNGQSITSCLIKNSLVDDAVICQRNRCAFYVIYRAKHLTVVTVPTISHTS